MREKTENERKRKKKGNKERRKERKERRMEGGMVGHVASGGRRWPEMGGQSPKEGVVMVQV